MARPLSACEHCGLPAPGGARYCCYGCELAARVQAEAQGDHGALLGTLSFTLVLSMIVMMLSLFLYAEDVFADAAADQELAWMRTACRAGALLFATPVVLLAGGPLFRRALGELRAGRMSMEALIVAGAVAAYALSARAVLAGTRGIYLDSATAALVLATFGRYLEAGARSRASRALGPLLEVSRAAVYRVVDGGAEASVSAAEIMPGTRICVPPEQVVPADLALEVDVCEVDLAVVSGESRPVTLARGAVIPAGAVPVGRELVGRALRPASESALERLGALAKSLEERSAPTLRWADRFAGGLVPAAAVLAAATLIYWTRAVSFDRGVVNALAVVLAACPCSYAIASPLVHWLALRSAFARGVLVRSPDALEALARVRIVAFDKTGTLCKPDLAIVSARVAPSADPAEVRGLVRALEADATHPVARALRAWAGDSAEAPVVADRRYVGGRGVFARDVRGRALFLGRGAAEEIVLTRDGEDLACFTLDEALRPEAASAVDELHRGGLEVVVLSGDAEDRVARVGAALGVAVEGGLSPEDKIARLGALGGGVVMVGDGLNDVPALAGCAVSITLGDATPLAKGVAHVTLLDPDLSLVPWTVRLGRRSVRLVQWLLGASTAYNAVFLALAAAGALRPVFAGLSMLVSSLIALSFAASVGSEERAHHNVALEEQAAC